MPVEFPCDILVVGAGPAGSCAAAVAAREGMRTVLIDAKLRIGEQPHCGEFVPQRLFVEFDLNRSSVIHRIDSMETRIIDMNGWEASGDGPESATAEAVVKPLRGQYIEVLGEGSSGLARRVPPDATLIASPGFLIDRVRFDRDLAREAAGAGATVLCATRLLHTENGIWTARSGKEETRLSPRFVIAADGALSTVARCLDLEQPDVLRGLQVEAPFSGDPDRTYVYLGRSFVGGYGWIFPKGKTANVGIGLVPARGLDAGLILAQFLDHLLSVGLIRPGQLARWGGLIPVSGIRDSLVVGNVVFCGDAAGLTHPVTGAGIPQAVFSGRQAGRAVASAIKSGRGQYLAEYEAEINGCYRGIIGHALKKRRVMMEHWNEPDFSRMCQRTWIAFDGYRLRERFK